jgi:hypothetical protein
VPDYTTHYQTPFQALAIRPYRSFQALQAPNRPYQALPGPARPYQDRTRPYTAIPSLTTASVRVPGEPPRGQYQAIPGLTTGSVRSPDCPSAASDQCQDAGQGERRDPGYPLGDSPRGLSPGTTPGDCPGRSRRSPTAFRVLLGCGVSTIFRVFPTDISLKPTVLIEQVYRLRAHHQQKSYRQVRPKPAINCQHNWKTGLRVSVGLEWVWIMVGPSPWLCGYLGGSFGGRGRSVVATKPLDIIIHPKKSHFSRRGPCV